MYVHKEPTNENSLEKTLQEAKETEHPFILDLTHLDSLGSKSIKLLIETHTCKQGNFYILLPTSSLLMDLFKRESLLGMLTIFNRLKDLEELLVQQKPPVYLDYVPGKLFTIQSAYQEELDRVAEASIRTGESLLSVNLRDEFSRNGFSLPQRLLLWKDNDEWQICEYKDNRSILPQERKVLYVIRRVTDGYALAICERIPVYSLYGTLQGQIFAEKFFDSVKKISQPLVFIDLNNCYSWDEHYLEAFKNIKEHKKVYLIKSDKQAVSFAFQLKGDIVYNHFDTAYAKAKLVLTKSWTISPDPADATQIKPVVEISGYIRDREEDIVDFRKKFIKVVKRALKHLRKVCIDIRELYRLEDKARKAFVNTLIKWTQENKIRKFNIIIVATLPRPDYIVHDVIADLYSAEFFIVSTVEEAMDMHASYPQPRFIAENSSNASILKLEGNIIHEREKKSL